MLLDVILHITQNKISTSFLACFSLASSSITGKVTSYFSQALVTSILLYQVLKVFSIFLNIILLCQGFCVKTNNNRKTLMTFVVYLVVSSEFHLENLSPRIVRPKAFSFCILSLEVIASFSWIEININTYLKYLLYFSNLLEIIFVQ